MIRGPIGRSECGTQTPHGKGRATPRRRCRAARRLPAACRRQRRASEGGGLPVLLTGGSCRSASSRLCRQRASSISVLLASPQCCPAPRSTTCREPGAGVSGCVAATATASNSDGLNVTPIDATRPRRAAATTRPEVPGGRSIPPRRLPGIRHSSGPPVSGPPVSIWEICGCTTDSPLLRLTSP